MLYLIIVIHQSIVVLLIIHINGINFYHPEIQDFRSTLMRAMNKYSQINGSPVKKPQIVIRNREEEAHDALTWAQDAQLTLAQDQSGNNNEYSFETQTLLQNIQTPPADTTGNEVELIKLCDFIALQDSEELPWIQ